MQDLQDLQALPLLNPERVQTPQGLVQACTPRFTPEVRLTGNAPLGHLVMGQSARKPSQRVKTYAGSTLVARYSLPVKNQPATPATTIVAQWKGYNPKGELQAATMDICDVQSEQSGMLMVKGRNAYFTQARLNASACATKADARFVAMHRTRKGKAGDNSQGRIENALEEATFRLQNVEEQIAFLSKVLTQKHVGKLRISKRKLAYAKATLPSLKKNLPKLKRAVKRYQRSLGIELPAE